MNMPMRDLWVLRDFAMAWGMNKGCPVSKYVSVEEAIFLHWVAYYA